MDALQLDVDDVVLGETVTLPTAVAPVTARDVIPGVGELEATAPDLDADSEVVGDPLTALVLTPLLSGADVAKATHTCSFRQPKWLT